MNRLGFRLNETSIVKRMIEDVGYAPQMIMSHLACADQPQHEKNRTQLALFSSVINQFPGIPASLANSAATMTSREIRPLPGQAGVLQVQASIRNDARWAQAWPDLRLSLSDADGRVIGSGVFTPAQYLGESPATTVLEPGQSARIAFRVQEPAASTVAFTFDFL